MDKMSVNPEDVWEDDPPEEIAKDTKIHMSHLFQEGFRAGVAKGQEEKVQSGFDKGYDEGVREGFAWGKCEGVLDMHQALKGMIDDSDTSQKLDQAWQLMNTVSTENVYASSYNASAAAKHDEGTPSQKVVVLPERIEVGKDVGEKVAEIKQLVELSGL